MIWNVLIESPTSHRGVPPLMATQRRFDRVIGVTNEIVFFFFVFIASTKGEYPRLGDKKFTRVRVCRRVRSYDGGIKSLERSALRLKRKSTQNFCVTKSSTHVIPKMMSKSMWGEEMKCEIGIVTCLYISIGDTKSFYLSTVPQPISAKRRMYVLLLLFSFI